MKSNINPCVEIQFFILYLTNIAMQIFMASRPRQKSAAEVNLLKQQVHLLFTAGHPAALAYFPNNSF